MKIALIGYGKMGHMIEGIALERGHEIVGIIDPTLVNGDCSLVTDFDSEEFRSADVAIEFTTPATAKENVLRAWAQNVPVVCGTTGWKPEELVNGDWSFVIEGSRKVVKDEKGKTMLVWSSNFSVGVNIFFEMNKFLAQKMKNLTPRGSMDVHRTSNRAEPFTRQGEGEKGEGYTPSITETHHIHKLDKPSGTAKTLAEQIENELPSLQGEELRSIEGPVDVHRTTKRGRLPIESIREGEVPGTHVVTWDSKEDTIIITHIAKGRRGFALGAVLAAESLV